MWTIGLHDRFRVDGFDRLREAFEAVDGFVDPSLNMPAGRVDRGRHRRPWPSSFFGGSYGRAAWTDHDP